MFRYDFHIHTELCGHAPGQTVELILAAADRLGLEIIAITEHVSSVEDMRNIDVIRSEVRKYHGACRVIIGAEADVDRRHLDGRLVLDDRHGLDYIIGSIHYLPGTNVLPHCDLARPLSPEETFVRWRSTLLGLVSNPIIDTLGHPGVMIANALDDRHFSVRVLEVLNEAAIISAKNEIAWELNNHAGAKLPDAHRHQYDKVMQLAVTADVRIVYGSDAHSPENIGGTGFVSEVLSRLAGTMHIGTPLEL
ncbi:MAG: PHP domain-containing protein [Victivallales bacterium]